MDIIRKYSKTHYLQKENFVTVKKKKIDQWEEPAFTENVLYYARISCDDETYKPKLYKGIYETAFKKRYANHKRFFNAENNKNDTKLSTEYWKLGNKKLNPRIFWSIKGNYKSYKPNSKRCSLCLHEKIEILDDYKKY